MVFEPHAPLRPRRPGGVSSSLHAPPLAGANLMPWLRQKEDLRRPFVISLARAFAAPAFGPGFAAGRLAAT